MNLARPIWLGIPALIFVLAQSATAAVTVTQKGGKLKLKGDATNNKIELIGTTDSGAITVLVNQATVDTFEHVRDLQISCGAGNDFLTVSGIQIGGSLKIKTNGGNDFVFIRGDSTQLERELLISGKIDADLGGQVGDNFLLVSGTIRGATIGGGVRVRGASDVQLFGDGLSHTSNSRDVRIGGNLTIDAVPEALISMSNVNVHGDATIETRASADSVEINTCHFLGALQIRTRGGDDTVMFAKTVPVNLFSGAVLIDAGPGTDTTNAGTAETFESTLTVTSAEVQL